MIEWEKTIGCKVVDNPVLGHAHLGMSPGGAMDQGCFNGLKNRFEFSTKDSVIWEVSLFGVSLVAKEKLYFVFVGAARLLSLEKSNRNDVVKVYKNQIFEIQKGQRLNLGTTNEGVYSYLLISRERISEKDFSPIEKRFSHPIRVYPGPEINIEKAKEFCQYRWRVSPNSNRMGIRLCLISSNTTIENQKLSDCKSYPSNPVWDGVVQWTGSELIVLHRERATLGGYPRVLEVNEIDLSRVSQYKPGEIVHLELITK